MPSNPSYRLRTLTGAAAVAALLAWTPADARVTKIVINTTVDPDNTLAPFGDAGPLKRLTGIAFGELDPRDERNEIIQDIRLAPKNARSKGQNGATFLLNLPPDPAKISGLLGQHV